MTNIESPSDNNPSQETSSPQEQNLSKEQTEQYEQWMKGYPEIIIAPEDLRECGPEIAEFEEMIATFESAHSLSDLHLIIDLKPEDAAKYPLRESAKAALIPIVAKLNRLKKETNIAPEKYEELRIKYMRLSRAVGIINNNKVDHNR